MTLQDMQKARAEAEATLEFRRQLKAVDTLNELSPELFASNVQTVLLDLTDPTPLTVERLVEAGGTIHDGISYTFPQGVSVNVMAESWTWFFTESTTYGNDETVIIDHRIAPRTVGELRQLLLRMGDL